MDDHKFTINDLMQKILIINGSPRKNGNISKMLEAIKEETEKQGANVSAVHVHDLQVRPCNGCMSCRKNLACVLPEDGAQSHAPVNKLVRRAGYRRPVLLGKLAGRIKNPVRPHRLRDDGRKPERDSPTATQGEKSHHREYLHDSLPVQYTFQPNERNRQSTKGNSQMERIQDHRHRRERRYEKIPLAGKRFPALSKNRPQNPEIITIQTN